MHAVDQPVRAPQFPTQNKRDPASIKVFRVKDDDGARRDFLKNLQPLTASNYGNPGDTGIVFSGTIKFDRETSRQVELRADCALPNTSVFDDPIRFGRTANNRLTGTWPPDLSKQKQGGKDAQPIGRTIEISAEPRDCIEIRLLRRPRQIADRHVFNHALAKRADRSHLGLLS